MSICIRPKVRLPLDQRILCSEVIVVKKCIMVSPDSLLVFCAAQTQDTFRVYDQSYSFAQPAIQTARWR